MVVFLVAVLLVLRQKTLSATASTLARYPTLTKSDLQICCLTKQGFSNQVISILMNIQTGSYARRKSRIKQEKMNGLQDERSYEEIIAGI